MDLERIIESLLAPDTALIQQGTKDLENAFKHPETIVGLCNIMATHEKAERRQCAAMLLKKRFARLRLYQQIPAETQQHIKNHLVNTVFNEKENSVRGAMTQFLGCILRHNSRSDEAWVDGVLQFILTQCSSSDPQIVEIGSFVLAKLADVTPEPFVQRFNGISGLFQAALLSVESNTSANISPAVMYNILTAMGALVPNILGNTEVEKTYQAAVPHLVNVVNKFAADGLIAHFTVGLEVLQNMSECTPALLNPHVRLLMEFTLAISSNANYDPEIRIKALTYVCFLVREKKKLLVKLKLIEPIMNVVFNIMASEPESDDADEFFVESETETPLAAATVVIDTMAVNMPPEKFIPPLLALLEPALQNPADELRRRAAYIVLATISEGCRDAICDRYLEPMLTILKQGLSDPVSSVRSAALFAVGQFSEQLQPEIAEYANDVLPLLMKYMQEILQAHQMGQQLEPKHVERVFYALEAFCESLEDALAPFMENLMAMVLGLLDNSYPQRLQILAMALTEAAAKAYKGSLLPWFQPLITKLNPLLLQDDKSDPDGMRSQAINTLAAIARNIDQQFRPFASETTMQCVEWIEKTDDIDIRKSLLNLFGALAAIVGEELSVVLPIILKHINRCMDEGSDLPPGLVSAAKAVTESEDDDDDEIDLDNSSDDESDSEDLYLGDNPYLQAQEQALLTIKDLADACPRSLLPHAQGLFETAYKVFEHCFIDVRRSSIVATKSLAIKWFELEPEGNVRQAINILLPKLVDVVRKESEAEIVIEAHEGIGDILAALRCEALPTKQLRDSIAQCIKDGLTYKYVCQFGGDSADEDSQDEEDSESDKAVIEGAANLLTSLGKAVSSDEFAGYFKLLEPLVMKHIKNNGDGDMQSTRGYLIGVLAECYAPLGANVQPFFAKHFNILLRATKDRNARTRQNAVFGLGELVRAGKEVSYSYYPNILENLSQVVANEKKRVVVDNIVGALARLILTNAQLVPLEHVLPVMLQKLPIVDDEVESIVVIECFDMLYNTVPEAMQSHVGAVVAIAVQSISKSPAEQTLVEAVVKLLHVIRARFPGEYQQAIAEPILASLLPEQAAGLL